MFDAIQFNGGPYPVNRRADYRYRSYLHGKLLFENPALNSDCTIRNLSQIGAKIEIPEGDVDPANALLLVTKSGSLHETTTIWTAKTALGLRFDRSFDLSAGPPSRLAEGYRIWWEGRSR